MRPRSDTPKSRRAPAFRALAAALVAASFASTAAGTARADQFYTGSSSSYEVSSTLNLTLLGATTVNGGLAPTTLVSGTAPAAYNTSQTLANVNLGVGTGNFAGNLLSVGNGQTGSGATTFTSSVASNVTGLAQTSGMTTATASAANLSLGVLSLLNTPLLSLNIPAVTSTSTITASGATLTATATSSITNGSITILGTTANLAALTPGATVTTNLAGLTIGTNIITMSGDGISSKTITDDALVLTFNNVNSGLLGGVNGLVPLYLNGSIIVGQSTATMGSRPTPEPASAALTVLGLGLAGFGARRKLKRRGLPGRTIARA